MWRSDFIKTVCADSGQCLKWNPYRNANQRSATATLTKNKREVKIIKIIFGGDVTICVYFPTPYVTFCH